MIRIKLHNDYKQKNQTHLLGIFGLKRQLLTQKNQL